MRKLHVGYGNLALDGVDGYGERLPIEIADGDGGRNENCHLQAESVFHNSGFFDTV
jgi:hypothetical protein